MTAMLVVSVVSVSSCNKDDDSDEREDEPIEVTINPEYVAINWEQAILVSDNDDNGTYQIQFNGTIPDIHPGSIITIDQDTAVLYRFVTTSSTSGNIMTITSTEAYLTDIFANTEFTLTTATSSGKSNTHGPIFRPVSAYFVDEHGTYRKMDMNRKGETHFTHDLWRYGFNHNGHVLHAGSNDSIVLDRMNMDLDIDFEMYMNFSGRDVHEVVNDAIDRYMSRALKVDAALIGNFNTEYQIRCKSWGSTHLQSPAITLVSDMFPLPNIRFVVGSVPVIIKVQPDLCCQMEVNTSDVIQAYTGFTNQASGRLGFKWTQEGGIVPVHNFENDFRYTPPALEGKGEIQAKIWIFPRINFLLYSILGPTIDFMPYANFVVRGGFREQMLGQSNDYCAWTYDYHAGMDYSTALNFNIFGRWFVNDVLGGIVDVHTPIVNIEDLLVYHSPVHVVHVSGRPQVGQTGMVYFNVYDRDFRLNADVLTPFPQIVKFEANGQLSSEYGIANNGIVSVNWTPTNNDILRAQLYDVDGNIIAWDTVMVGENDSPDEPYFPTTTWVDLGLPSGLLWASCNVGALSITDYGYYYSWGDTDEYSGETYIFINENGEFTKYTGNDGLIILQSEDDIAVSIAGGRMPTKEEWQELLDNTTGRMMNIDGVNGYCISGQNGNSIFLPAAGFHPGYAGRTGLWYVGSEGVYWTSSLVLEDPTCAYSLYLWFHDNVFLGGRGRFCGASVRPVQSPNR